MCTRYISPEAGDIERHWHFDSRNAWRGGEIFPNYQGPFIRAPRASKGLVDSAESMVSEAPRVELVIGQWSLIPWFAKERKLKYPTSNARSEELMAKASYKLPWSRGQRCIIPAWAFFEPNWETGKHEPWIFRRADGLPWGLAGLWNAWADPLTGELVESYTMLTQNADAHPLIRRMHRPDPKRPSDMQDKRSVVPIKLEDAPAWLFGTVEQAKALVQLPETELIDACPT